MNDALPIPSDRALVAAARDGSDEAWDVFRSRHEAAVHGVAAATGPDATARTERAFARLHDDLLNDADDGGAGAPGVRALRPRAIAAVTGGAYGPPSTTEPADGDATAVELAMIAQAFARLPEAWQTVLWHRHVEGSPAALLAGRVARSAAEIVALQTTAERGLFDSFCAVVVDSRPPPHARCHPIIGQLGGYRRGTLPPAQMRAVEAHLVGGGPRVPAGSPAARGTESGSSGCEHCRRRMALADDMNALLAVSVVPALTGLTVGRYRSAVGAPPAVVGSAALAARRSERTSRRTRAGAVAAVVLAVLAAAFFIRAPFGDLQPDLAAILDDVSAPPTLPSGGPTTTDVIRVDSSRLPNRIELLFPAAPQGLVYPPGGPALDLSIDLSTPGPVLAGGTGTVDARITNLATEAVSADYYVLLSEGLSFDELAEGDGTCRAERDGGASCSVSIGPGETAAMAMRFFVDADVPDRLVVDPGVASKSLEVPVHFVSDLVVGLVDRGEIAIVGGTFGPCTTAPDCPDGTREASSADLELAAGADVELALLVWEGYDTTRPWSGTVGLTGPASDVSTSVESDETVFMSSPGTAPFRSTAVVTDAVRAAGSGRYTVARPAGASGRGSWTLVVVASVNAPGQPRRLFIVTAPTAAATPEMPLAVEFPVVGSVPPTDDRPGVLSAQGWATTVSGTQSLRVDGAEVGGGDPFGIRDASVPGGDVRSYDLEIAPTDAALPIVASTTDGALRVTALGVTVDVAP